MLKLTSLLLCGAALVICSGCANVHPGREQAYAPHAGAGAEREFGGAIHGTETPGTLDYHHVLSDPGPF